MRHSNVMLSSQLRLTFTALPEADMLSILSHYNGQYGTFDSFILPSAIWAGVTQADYELPGYRWRYIEPPVVEDVYCDRYTVDLIVETIPPAGAATDGGVLKFRFSVEGIGAFAANGLARTVTTSFAASGAGSAGAELSVVASLVGGNAAAANGYQATVTFTFAPGATEIGDYWADMGIQLYGWESLGYIEWWGN